MAWVHHLACDHMDPIEHKWLGLYVLIATLAILACLTLVILNGHDIDVLIAGICAFIPLLTGVGVLVKQNQSKTGGKE